MNVLSPLPFDTRIIPREGCLLASIVWMLQRSTWPTGDCSDTIRPMLAARADLLDRHAVCPTALQTMARILSRREVSTLDLCCRIPWIPRGETGTNRAATGMSISRLSRGRSRFGPACGDHPAISEEEARHCNRANAPIDGLR